MPEYLSPGVYVEEIAIGGSPIEGVSTSTAGFLGEAERGPAGTKLVTSFAQYERVFGGYSWANEKGAMVSSSLPYAIEGFFANGGKRCYVGRVVGAKNIRATATLKGQENISISAAGGGAWGNRLGIMVKTASGAEKGDKTLDKSFRLIVYYWSTPPADPPVDPHDSDAVKSKGQASLADSEDFDNLSWDHNSQDYYARRLKQSHLIEVALDAAAAAAAPAPAAAAAAAAAVPAQPAGAALKQDKIVLLKGGKDGDAVEPDDYKGDSNEDEPSGLAALEVRDDISIVCVPDEAGRKELSNFVVAHCERLKDRIAILQAGLSAGNIGDLYPVDGSIDSKYAAFYYPWIQVLDPVSKMPKMIPPGGHVAGVYARSDTERGVHKAPANEPVRLAVDLQFNVTTGEQDILNPRGVNCIRSFQGRGILVWGARTTSRDPLWKYVNVRRLFIFLEKSIQRSTQWVVFEPNNERLWVRVRQSVNDFLFQVWKDGMLMGATPEEAFFVKCDKPSTMTDNDVENGRLVVVIGVAPARPAEFVIFRLAQWCAGSEITE